jgi:TonB family protein
MMASLLSAAHRENAPNGLAAAVSAVAHAFLIVLLLDLAGHTDLSDMSRLLPALYLYAPDRHPEMPRVLRLPILAPLGDPLGSDRAVTAELPAGPTPVRPRHPPGLPPTGAPAAGFDSVFSVLAVDSEVVRYPGSAAPAYPTDRLLDRQEGEVEAEFVVDTMGLVDVATIRILSSTHPDFTDAVGQALAQTLFRPAWRNGRKVSQLVHQRFSFRIYRPPGEDDIPM